MRKHPAMRWMEQYTYAFDKHEHDQEFFDKWYSDDFVLIMADGTEYKGKKDALVKLKEVYGALIAHYHDPYYSSTVEGKNGTWEMIGQAKLYAKLPGNPAEGEKPVKDPKGRSWDIALPAAFKFVYAKGDGPEGLLMTRTELMSDSTPIVMTLLKRGVMSPADLGL